MSRLVAAGLVVPDRRESRERAIEVQRGMNMNTLKSFQNMLIWLLVLLLAIPSPVFAQEGKATPKRFSQEELDQVLAPIALYPDSLLAQVFIASNYPL